MLQVGKIRETGYPLIGIGNCYFHLDYFPLSEKYYRKAAEVFMIDSNYFGNSVALNNIGLIKEKYHQFDSALVYFERALQDRKNSRKFQQSVIPIITSECLFRAG